MMRGITYCTSCGRPVRNVVRPFGLPSWVCRACHAMAPAGPYGPVDHLVLKEWAGRLASRNQAEREAEIEDLVAMGPPARAVLADQVRTAAVSERAKEAMVAALGRLGGPESVNALLDLLAQQERREAKRRKQRPLILGGYLIAVLLVAVLPLLLGDRSNVVNGASFSGAIVVLLAARAVALRQGAAKALGALKEPRAVGPLALAAGEQKVSKTALPILRDLLPLVTDEHVAAFTDEEKAAIVALLKQKDYQIVSGALRVVAMFGAEDAREQVERIAREGPEPLRGEAEKALASIRGRIEMHKDRATLLRASTSVDGIPSDTLLRPAAAQPDPEPTQLLRQADTPGDSEGNRT